MTRAVFLRIIKNLNFQKGEKMKKFLLTAFVAFSVSGSVFAQADNFTGLSTAVSLKGSDTSVYADIFGSTSYGADVRASYGFVLSKDIILNVGASINIGSNSIYKFNPIETFSQSAKVKNLASIYLEPGVLLSNNTLVYGKISHNTGKFQYTYNDAEVSVSESTTKSGIGLGLGVRTMFNEKTFIQFELNRAALSSKANNQNYNYLGFEGDRAIITSASVGIGYKF